MNLSQLLIVKNKEIEPKFIYNTDNLENNEIQLFKLILLHNKIDLSFQGQLEIYEID